MKLASRFVAMNRGLLVSAFSLTAVLAMAAETAPTSNGEKEAEKAPAQAETDANWVKVKPEAESLVVPETEKGPATEKLAPDLHLESSLSTSWATREGSQSSLSSPEAESARRTYAPVGSNVEVAPSSAGSPSTSLAPIATVPSTATTAVRTFGANASSGTVQVSAETARAIGFFASASVATSSAQAAPVVGSGRQIISPTGRGVFGTDNFSSLTLRAGGIYYYDLVVTGQRLRTDLVTADSLSFGGTISNPFTISVASFSSPNTPGLLPSRFFDSRASYEWVLIETDKPFAFNPNGLVLDTSGFRNDLKGGFFSLAADDNRLLLNFTPVPEPSTWMLLGTGAGMLLWFQRRSRAAKS